VRAIWITLKQRSFHRYDYWLGRYGEISAYPVSLTFWIALYGAAISLYRGFPTFGWGLLWNGLCALSCIIIFRWIVQNEKAIWKAAWLPILITAIVAAILMAAIPVID
jgi:hypothetical protein